MKPQHHLICWICNFVAQEQNLISVENAESPESELNEQPGEAILTSSDQNDNHSSSESDSSDSDEHGADDKVVSICLCRQEREEQEC